MIANVCTGWLHNWPAAYVSRNSVRCRANSKIAAQGEAQLKHLRTSFAVLAATLAVATAAVAGGVAELPKDIQQTLYSKDMLDPMQPVAESPYRDWKPKKGPPWKIGYASSYAGNTWRANVMDRLQNTLIPKWKKLGLISEVVVTQSNLNDSTQISANAPTRRPRRRCNHRLLLQPDSVEPNFAIRPRPRSSSIFDIWLYHFALFREFFGQFRCERQHARGLDGQRNRRQGQRARR